MIARLPRPLAWLLALLLAGMAVWCLTAKPPPIKTAGKGGYTDVRLYHDIARGVAAGKPYHLAAAEMHRAHHYPLKPFVTMRPPTLVWLAAKVGWPNLQRLAMVLSALAIFAWVVAFEGMLDWSERVLVAVAVGAGCSVVVNEGLMALHEYWAGWFTAIALAGVIGWPRKWGLILLPAALGLAVRELALPFALLSLAFALIERKPKQVLGWIVLIAAFGLGMWIHANEVAALVRPGDITSPGWHAGQGFSAFLKAVIFTSVLQDLPLNLALLAAMLPLLGWAALGGRAGLFALLFIGGDAFMISAFSRADTFYWGAIMLPHYFVGFALLPRAFWQLGQAVRFEPGKRKGFPLGGTVG
ncbi:MAG: hypothetical protein KGN34_16640 [Sphingomonadales bacterium]|nr:hypothetical protein [Sphingomonadales bacterium]